MNDIPHLARIRDVLCLHVNEDEVRRDFPELAGLSLSQLEQFFESECALLSRSQIEHADRIMFPVPTLATEASGQNGIRRAGMGRSCTVALKLGDCDKAFDIKGCGVDDGEIPMPDAHSNGLLGLLPGLREYLFTAAVKRGLESLEGESLRPAKLYAILLLPFYTTIGSKLVPCVLLIREALSRAVLAEAPLAKSAEWWAGVRAEYMLRSIGLSSCMSDRFVLAKGVLTDARTSNLYKVAHKSEELDKRMKEFLSVYNGSASYEGLVANIQMGKDPGSEEYVLVDLEHFKLSSALPFLPVVFPASDRMFGMGGHIESELLPKADPSPALSSLYSYVAADPRIDAYFWCHRMASDGRIFSHWSDVLLSHREDRRSSQKLRLKECVATAFDNVNNVRRS